MEKIKPNELRLRSDIAESLRTEQRRIDNEIKELRRVRRELANVTKNALTVGRRAYILMGTNGEPAARKFADFQREASGLCTRVIDMRGYCDLWRELNNRHVDLWVTLGNHPLD